MPVNLGSAEGYIDLDFSSLLKGVDSSLSAIKKLDSAYTESESQLRKMESQLKTSGSAFQAAAQQSQRLSLELESAKKKADTYRKAIEGMETASKNAANEQAQLKSKIEAADARLEKAEQKVKSLSDAYKAASQATKDAASAYGEQSEEAQKAAAAEEELKIQLEKATEKANAYRNELLQLQTKHQKLGQDMETAREKTAGFRTELNNTEAKINDLTRELAEAESVLLNMGTSMEKVGGKFKSAGEKIDRVGSALSLGVTAPLVGIGTAAVNAGNDFEAQMSRVSAIADAYGDELEQLREQAIELGASTSFSATGAAEAMENLASAGFKTQEIMEAMPGMLDLAASSGEDLATSADIAASTLRGFQLNASDAAHVADVLAKNAADTNAAIVDTGYAMKYIAPVAASVGWSLEEVTAAIGKMADAGIKGEQAGTTLRGALTRLMKPTDDMYAVMEDLGISFYDAQGKMKPLSTIIDDLQKSMKGLTDEQRDNNLAYLFGTEALSGMKVLLASSKEELDRMTEGLKNADGAAKKMADTMLDNTKGSIEEMNGSLETAGITIQKQLAPWITKGAEKVTELANEFANLDENTQGSVLAMAGIAAASGPVVKGLGKVTGGIGKLVTGTGGLIKDLGKLSSAKKAAEAIGSIGTFSTKSVEGVSGLSKILFKLASPTGAAIVAAGAIAGIGAAVVAAHKQMVKNDLAKRFGEIELSAEDCQDIAKKLTKTPWTMNLELVSDAQEKLEEIRESAEETSKEIAEYDYTLSLGIELTEEQSQSYKNAVDSYIQNAQDYLSQKQVTGQLAIDASFLPSSETYQSLTGAIDELYKSYNDKLQDLSSKMNTLTADAMEDGVISADESKAISALKEKMQGILDSIENTRYEAKLKALSVTTIGAEITLESLGELSDAIATETQKILDDSKQTYTITVEEIQFALAEGAIDEQAASEMMNAALEQALASTGESVLDGVDVLWSQITKSSGDIIEDYQGRLEKFLSENMDIKSIFDEQYGMRNWTLAISEIFSIDSDTMAEILNESKATIDSLEEQYQKYIDNKVLPPEAFLERYHQIDLAKAIAGEGDPWSFIAGTIMEECNGSLQKLNEMVGDSLKDFSPELKAAFENEYGIIIDETGKLVSNGRKQIETTGEYLKQSFAEFGMGLSDSLAQQLADAGPTVQKEVENLFRKLKDGKELRADELISYWEDLGSELPQKFADNLQKGGADVQKATSNTFLKLQNQTKVSSKELSTYFENLGAEIPKSLKSGLDKMSGELQGATTEYLLKLADNTSLTAVELESLWKNYGFELGENLKQGLVESDASVQESALMVFQNLKNKSSSSAEDLKNTFSAIGISVTDKFVEGLASNGYKAQQTVFDIINKMSENVQLTGEDLKLIMSDLGVESADSLVTALENKKADVQTKAIELISQLQNADEEKRPEILAQMLDLGQEVDANLCNGIASKLSLVKDEATGMISVIDTTTGTQITKITRPFAERLAKMGAKGFDAMEDEISNKKLDAPEIGGLSTKPVEDWRKKAQQLLWKNPLSVMLDIASSVASSASNHADGGIVQRETLSWLAEGDKPEAVIPLSTEKRARGLELWRQAGEELGAMDAARDVLRSTPSGSGSGGYDYRRLAAAVAAELRRVPIEVKPEFYVSSGDVYLEGEPVGRSLAPVIDSQLSRLQERRKRGG